MPPLVQVQTPAWVGAAATFAILLLPAAVPRIAKSTRHLLVRPSVTHF
jgi:hypothetical protein